MVADAFISAEDRNFWEHQGYDPRAIAAAFVEAVQTRGQSCAAPPRSPSR
jgi:penicillin-binding protein 1A